MATLWKNGVAVRLTDGTKDSWINSISVVNNDVYAAGVESIRPYSRLVAKYWKNGVETQLTDGTKNAYAQSVAVNGNDVYVVGYEWGLPVTSYTAKFWKNGILSDEINNSTMTKPQSVQVYGNDVFIAGNSKSSSGNSQASYCKNGKLVLLDNTGFTTSVANSIFVAE